jgi:DNA-directed RNA polymerase specialized sigma24 family protein
MTRRGESWALDPPAFERLLGFLDPDRQAAALKYEDIRRRLMKLFIWRGCTAPEECADRAIDRVARRLGEGVDVNVRDPYHYFQGVALNVLREHIREPVRAWESLDDDPRADRVGIPGATDDATSDERRMACLDRCLDELLPKNRELLLDYHRGDRHIETRQSLAAALGIPLNALRIRVHRLRVSVETCVTRCLMLASAETDPADSH